MIFLKFRARFLVSFLFLTIFLTIFSNIVLAEQVIQAPLSIPLSKVGDLTFNNVTATEGADSFALQVKLLLKNINGADSDDYSYRGQKLFELDPMSIYDFVKVKPEIKFTINFSTTGFILSGAFKPETNYEVKILRGLKVKTGQELATDTSRTVKTGSFKPHIRFSSKSRYVPGLLAGNLTFESVNVKAIEISIRQVFSQNLHQWLTSGEFASQYVSEEIKSHVINVKSKRNAKYKGVISLDEFNPMGNGIYVISATEKKTEPVAGAAESAEGEGGEAGGDNYDRYSWATDFTSVVVSNLSAVVKWGPKKSLTVWVLKTGDLAPVNGVNVELYSDSNRKLDTCITEGSHAECNLKWKDSKSAPYAVVVRSSNDATYIKLVDLAINNDRFHVGSRDFVSDQQGFDAFLYSARDLYRPGEKVELSVQVRNKKFEAVDKLPLLWKIINPKGKIIREGSTISNEFGLSHLPFQTQLSFETGKYQTQVWAGKLQLHEFSFLLEEFVPERIGLSVKAEQESYINKTMAAFNLEALYLFGPPVVQGEFKASCTLLPAFKKIPKNPDFFTGYYQDEMNKAVSLDVVTGKTDDQGNAKFNCEYQNQIGKHVPVIYELRAKTDVAEAGSSRVTSKVATTLVGSTDTLVGLKVLDKSGSEIKIEGGFFDFKGVPMKRSATLKARLYRIDQHWNYSYDSAGHHNWKVEEMIVPTGIEKIVTVNDAKFEVAMKPPESWGQWLVRVEDTNSGYIADVNTGYIGWYYDGAKAGGSAVRAPEDLKMEISKKRLSPGEKFKALFQAPFAGRLLVTLESNIVHESKWVNILKPGTFEVEFTAPNVLPNFYVTGLLIKNPIEGKRFLPARAFGAQNIEVIPNEHKLTVQIKAPVMMESRRELKIEISNEQKSAAEYTVAVVDEGILQITNFKSPNPLSRFFESRRLGVSSSETIGWTMAGVAKGKATPGGDGAGSKGSPNIPVRLLAFYNPSVKSDSSGRAVVSFDISEFQGKVRIMVVASHKTRMGAADAYVTVRDPIVIQSTLPRFLTSEDRFQFPVALTNTSGKAQKVTVSVETSSEVKILSAVQSLTLADNQMKVMKFPVAVTGATGFAEIKVSAKSEDGKLSSTESFSLKIRPKGIEQTLRLAFSANETIVLEKIIPADWRGDYLKISATLSNLPFLGQISQVEYLLRYPYGCIEQTTSTTLPLLAMEDLLQFVAVSSKKAPKIKEMANSGIARVMSMQTGSGGFSYWPGDTQASPWGTAYATYMLLEAKKLGYEVSSEVIDSALDYMQSYVREKPFSLASAEVYDTLATPWMLFVLAKGGRQVTSELRKTIEKYNQKITVKNFSNNQGENVFLLATTAKALGDNETLNKLMDEELLSKQLSGARDHAATYWSSLRSDGMRLAIIQDLWPNDPAVQILSQRVASNLEKSGGYTTQEVAWGVLALGKLVRGFEKIRGSELKKLSLLMNGKAVPEGYETQGLPTWVLEGALNKNVLSVKNAPKEKNAVWLYLNISGVTQNVPKGNNILTVQRSYLDRSGSTVDPQKVKQGDVLTVNLQFSGNTSMDLLNVAIIDRIPAGFEIENSRLGRGEEISWINKETLFQPDYLDIRDDRIQFFGTVREKKEFYYSVRAVTPGKFLAPPPMIEQMYDPESINYGSATGVEIMAK